MTHLKVAPLCTGHRKLLAQPCGAAARCRPRWLSFAAYITWICGSATGVELMWRSGGGVLNSSHGHQWVSIVGLCKSGCARPPPSPYLATYPHQLTFPSSHPVSPQGSLPHRLACLDQRAWVALWAEGVQPSLVVHGVFAAVLGMVAGSAVHVHASCSCELLVCLQRFFCMHLWIGWGSHGRGLKK